MVLLFTEQPQVDKQQEKDQYYKTGEEYDFVAHEHISSMTNVRISDGFNICYFTKASY